MRAFQYAWPPLAYSIEDDAEAARVYARITTYYVLFTGLVVAGLVLLGRWLVRIFAAPQFFAAHEALTVGARSAGRCTGCSSCWWRWRAARRSRSATRPPRCPGSIVNVALLAVLVPSLGIAGAGLALVGAYVVMLVVMWALTRNLFPVAFEWGRLAAFVLVAGGIAAAGELLLPTDGVVGLRHPRAGARRDPARALRARASSARASSAPRARLLRRAAAPACRLNSSAPSRRPSPRRGSSVAVTCLA